MLKVTSCLLAHLLICGAHALHLSISGTLTLGGYAALTVVAACDAAAAWKGRHRPPPPPSGQMIAKDGAVEAVSDEARNDSVDDGSRPE